MEGSSEAATIQFACLAEAIIHLPACAKPVPHLTSSVQHWHTDLLAAGAGAGVAAGFGAPMSGVIFAVETLLLNPAARRAATAPLGAAAPMPAAPAPRPRPAGGANAAAGGEEDDGGLQMASVLVACVFGAMLSQAGLGDEPAFRVPTAVGFQVRPARHRLA